MKTCPLCDSAYPNHQSNCDKDGALLIESRDLEPGTVIRGKYRVVRLLGHGGMGTVYLAEHILLGQHRALKFISSELSQDARFLKRFRHEAQAAIKLRHPNVVEVVDLDQAEDGSPYIAMEYVEGEDLRHALAAGAFPVERALAIAHGIAQGLGAAHAKGIVHRDVKPENILLAGGNGAPETPKLLDFGIAAIQESAPAVSRTHGLLLTAPYAAPEQWQGMASEQFDGRADLYALGGVLYEMLTGQTAFRSHNTEGWMYQHLHEKPPPPSRLRPELANWSGLDALVLRLLAKDREDRPKDAAELLGLLDAVWHSPPDVSRGTIAEPLRSRATEIRSGKWIRRLPRWVWITSVSLIALAIFITVLAFSLPTSMIDKHADDLDKAHHYNFGGILRNLACTRKDGVACDSLGEMYNFGLGVMKDDTRAASFYFKACEAGNGTSCNSLGQMYFGGTGVGKDYSRAAAYYIKACDAGDSLGCSGAANMYSDGKFVQEDDSRAKELYAEGLSIDSKDCNAGNLLLCDLVATEYEKGIDGVTRDTEKARQFFRKACSIGSKLSCDTLKKWDVNESKSVQVGSSGTTVQQSGHTEIGQRALSLYYSQRYAEARPLLDEACAGGNAESCDNLGDMYYDGVGVPEDYQQAVKLLSRACDKGSAAGCSDLGVAYNYGNGAVQSSSTAVKLYIKACHGGYAYGCIYSGEMYQNGEEVVKDIEKAKHLYSKACNLGNQDGCEDLGELH